MKKCLNCNHELQPYDKFCAYCGQKVDLSRKHFWAGLSDFFVDAFSFDSKVFVSLRDLLLKPGLITKQYNAGKQARFVPPLRMYLTITILFFLIDSYVDKLSEEKPWEAYKVENKEPYALLKIKDVDFDDDTTGTEDFTLRIGGGKYQGWSSWIRKHPGMAPKAGLDSLGVSATFWNTFAYEQIYKVARFNSQEFNTYLASKTQLLIFLFLPLIALVLKLIYWRHGIFYFEHLVFSLHIQSVFFVLLLCQTLIDFVFGLDASIVVIVLFVVYLLLALKRVYDQAWSKTVLKLFAFTISSLFSLTIFGLLMIVFLFVLF